ncbi:MAG: hypothetical protein EAZ39_18395 [Oscillatoriales cyanobacterium]|uniref:Ig-like domain-containing protein n=1 Tax=unclassified Microcoleus TaxID=2642155 RepID=UPI001D35D032|nr:MULTISPECIES: hypothetical protein [unclassified Microcoleus]TAF87501.1 MAG: hypothetical protein EAZ49_20095 [Oscillatoriales cyanobacterium]MCC3436925.1 hypothetical protein [Microcoleus sp. PH2017_05_CCC_O_A]MCC3448597.1 hypothetical protein [Microcoleus sp. PH2017_09_SFU_O_A]MCC3566397.1 hypothetical protein [Microcoleus sp. PH2017_31_RDM_U_A]MCC3578764.1 hypothetical protein [Microcoleus sp. PH2017_32_RDM_D_A]
MRDWHQFYRKQKIITVGYGTSVALVLVAIGCTAWDAIVVTAGIFKTTLGIFKTTPCLAYKFEDVNPLIAGKNVKLKIGEGSGSDCGVSDFALLVKPAVWSSQDTKVIQLSQDGTVTGIAPGKFTVLAKTGQKTLLMSGVVYPPDWDVRIQPEVATVRVGDRITFEMIASDSKGNLLPPLTFGLRTPDYQEPGPGAPTKPPNSRPLLDRTFHHMGAQPGTFRALRPGKIAITGKMGDRIKSAQLTIK